MTSELLSRLGLRIASVAAIGATGLAMTATPVAAATAAQKTTAAVVLHDYGTSLTNPADSATVVADNNNNNKNINIKPQNAGLKPAGLSGMA